MRYKVHITRWSLNLLSTTYLSSYVVTIQHYICNYSILQAVCKLQCFRIRIRTTDGFYKHQLNSTPFTSDIDSSFILHVLQLIRSYVGSDTNNQQCENFRVINTGRIFDYEWHGRHIFRHVKISSQLREGIFWC